MTESIVREQRRARVIAGRLVGPKRVSSDMLYSVIGVEDNAGVQTSQVPGISNLRRNGRDISFVFDFGMNVKAHGKWTLGEDFQGVRWLGRQGFYLLARRQPHSAEQYALYIEVRQFRRKKTVLPT